MSGKNMPEEFSTVARAVRVKVPIGQCRFFSSVKEVNSEEEARAFIEEVSAEFADATHNAWAYKLGYGEQAAVRYSDDGEPTNTAGPPTLQAIEGAGVTNVAVIGTRYFGGVKLGVGGLIRAYRETAQAGLVEAGVRTEIILCTIAIGPVDYADVGEILREIESCRGQVVGMDYGAQVTIRASIRPREVEGLRPKVNDITRGQGRVEVEE